MFLCEFSSDTQERSYKAPTRDYREGSREYGLPVFEVLLDREVLF